MVKKETAHFVLTWFKIHVNIKWAVSFLTLPEIPIFLWSIAVSRAKSSSKKRAHPKKEVLEHVQKQSSRTQKQTEKYK